MVGNPSDYFVIERSSYLGIACLILIPYAMVHRASLRHAQIWWSLFALVVVLGMGCYAQIGTRQVSLPTMWLWQVFPPFRLLRLPARFNLLAVIPAAVLAAYGLGHLLERLRGPIARGAVVTAVAALAIVDLGLLPYKNTYRLPPMPASYSWLKQHDPAATLFEWPILGPGTADRTYWQVFHGLPTSEGYSGVNNMAYVHRINMLSPLAWMWRPDYLEKPGPESYGPIRDVAFDDYLWLFLKANDYRYLVLNDSQWAPTKPAVMARLKEQLAVARVFEEGTTTIFEHARLPKPRRPVLACTEGWRSSAGFQYPIRNGVDKVARLMLYNTSADEALVFQMEAIACRSTRTVRLMAGPTELARWTVEPGEARLYFSPLFVRPAGVQDLTIESDDAKKPLGPGDSLDEAMTPYSLQVNAIRLLAFP